MEAIWVRTNWKRFIQYDSKYIPSDTEYFTIRNLSKEELEEIRLVDFKRVEEILSKYI